jgi:hypothetical protein
MFEHTRGNPASLRRSSTSSRTRRRTRFRASAHDADVEVLAPAAAAFLSADTVAKRDVVVGR